VTSRPPDGDLGGLDDLYAEVILEHGRKPRNFGPLPGANRFAKGHNPLCGDRITVQLELDDGTVRRVGFEGAGCAISTAAASLMTEAVRGKSRDEVAALFERFHELVTGRSADESGLGKLAAFHGVSEFPVRVKCATLPWHTLLAAIESRTEPVSTE
jgi:nitrogen fixation NifU-like protein